MSEEIEVKVIEMKLQKVSLSPDDVIVLFYDSVLPEKAHDTILSDVKTIFPDNKVMILEEGIKIGVIKSEKEAKEPVPPPIEEYSEIDVSP